MSEIAWLMERQPEKPAAQQHARWSKHGIIKLYIGAMSYSNESLFSITSATTLPLPFFLLPTTTTVSFSPAILT
jgi:hypothetical protein